SPTPSLAGTIEHLHVGNLAESTTYWFALIAVDDVGAASQLSNVLQLRTPDLTAPGAPGSFAVSAPSDEGREIPRVSASATSELGLKWGAGLILDDEATTSWSSQGSVLATPQSITVKLAKNSGVDQLRLLPDAFYPSLFPRSFAIELSSDG